MPAAPHPSSPRCATGRHSNRRRGSGHRFAEAPVPVEGPWNSVIVGDDLYLLTGDVTRPNAPPSFLHYDARTNAWTQLPPPPKPGGNLSGAGPTGLVHIGWSDENGAASDYRFDLDAQTWTKLPDDPLGPSFDRFAVWIDDRLLLATKDLVEQPGAKGPSLVRLASWEPASNRWTVGPTTELIGYSPTWVIQRVVWPELGSADGGEVGNWGRSYAYGGILDPETNSWSSLPEPPSGKGLGGELFTVDDKIVVGGHLLDPASRSWTEIPSPPTLHRTGTSVVPGDGAILAWGGGDQELNYADGYLLLLE